MLYSGIFHLQNVGVLKHMPSILFYFSHQVSQETNEEKKM
jgi:hypothetical protein